MFLHITIEVTSHSFSTVTPRRALQTQHLNGRYNISHFNHPPLGPLVVLIFRRSRDQREPGSSPEPERR